MCGDTPGALQSESRATLSPSVFPGFDLILLGPFFFLQPCVQVVQASPSHPCSSQPGSPCFTGPRCFQGNLRPNLGDTTSPSLDFRNEVSKSEGTGTVAFLTPSFLFLEITAHDGGYWVLPSPSYGEGFHVLLNSVKDLDRNIRPRVPLTGLSSAPGSPS